MIHLSCAWPRESISHPYNGAHLRDPGQHDDVGRFAEKLQALGTERRLPMGRPLHDDLDRSQPREGREDGEGTGLIRVPDRAEGAKDNALGGRGQLLVGRGREGTTGLSQVVVGILGTSWAVTIM